MTVPIPDTGNNYNPPGEAEWLACTKGVKIMKLTTSLKGVALVCATLLLGTGGALAAGPDGNWKRPNGSIAKVWSCGGGLCGKVVSGGGSGTTMFNGIKKVSGNKWKGNMKHPSMPSFMTFNGTVTLSGDAMHVQGCAMGDSMCDAEDWSRSN